MAVTVTPLMLEQDIISVAQYVIVVEKESGKTIYKQFKAITESWKVFLVLKWGHYLLSIMQYSSD